MDRIGPRVNHELDSIAIDLYFTTWLNTQSEPIKMNIDPLSTTLSAIADPTRRAILARLSQGKATVGEIAEPFDMSLPAISKHLKVLERAELIERGRQAQWRPCELRPEPLKEVADWLERYRQHWETQFQRLDGLLDELQASDPDPSTR